MTDPSFSRTAFDPIDGFPYPKGPTMPDPTDPEAPNPYLDETYCECGSTSYGVHSDTCTAPEAGPSTEALANPCNCEHSEHFDDPTPRTAHEYMRVEAGESFAMYVGLICDDCATGHLRQYLATNRFPCASCGAELVRFRGDREVRCSCGTEHNSAGQRLRDDWRGNPSNYDDEIGDLEGFEIQHAGDE